MPTKMDEERATAARVRAEASFRKEERAKDGAKAMQEYQAEGRAVRERAGVSEDVADQVVAYLAAGLAVKLGQQLGRHPVKRLPAQPALVPRIGAAQAIRPRHRRIGDDEPVYPG